MEAFAENVAAVSRDYVVEPRIRELHELARLAVCPPVACTCPLLTATGSLLEYQTVKGVSGPLVILENVKVTRHPACLGPVWSMTPPAVYRNQCSPRSVC